MEVKKNGAHEVDVSSTFNSISHGDTSESNGSVTNPYLQFSGQKANAQGSTMK
jgi:hypothetical protein